MTRDTSASERDRKQYRNTLKNMVPNSLRNLKLPLLVLRESLPTMEHNNVKAEEKTKKLLWFLLGVLP